MKTVKQKIRDAFGVCLLGMLGVSVGYNLHHASKIDIEDYALLKLEIENSIDEALISGQQSDVLAKINFDVIRKPGLIGQIFDPDYDSAKAIVIHEMQNIYSDNEMYLHSFVDNETSFTVRLMAISNVMKSLPAPKKLTRISDKS